MLQTKVRNAYTKSYQKHEFCQDFEEMLKDSKNLQLNYEEGTNIFSNTLCSLDQQSCYIIHLDFQQLQIGLDVFHRGR